MPSFLYRLLVLLNFIPKNQNSRGYVSQSARDSGNLLTLAASEQILDTANALARSPHTASLQSELIELGKEFYTINATIIILALLIQVRPKIDVQVISIYDHIRTISGMDSIAHIEFKFLIEDFFGVMLPEEIFLTNGRHVESFIDLLDLLHQARNT